MTPENYKTEAQHSAFPCEMETVWIGLTKREFFAAMAMRGILSNKTDILSNIKLQAQTVAEASSEYANALINELNKGETENGYSAVDEQPF